MGDFDGVPFVAISNEEIDALPLLGADVECWICGARHKVEEAGKTLAFMKCGKTGKSYLCGIKGREWKPSFVRGGVEGHARA